MSQSQEPKINANSHPRYRGARLLTLLIVINSCGMCWDRIEGLMRTFHHFTSHARGIFLWTDHFLFGNVYVINSSRWNLWGVVFSELILVKKSVEFYGRHLNMVKSYEIGAERTRNDPKIFKTWNIKFIKQTSKSVELHVGFIYISHWLISVDIDICFSDWI